MKKYIKIFLLELALVLVIFVYFLNKRNDIIKVDYNLELSSNDRIEYNNDINKNDLYNKLEKALLNGDSKVNMDLSTLFIEPDTVFTMLESISYENPEVMYYKGAEYSFGKVKLAFSQANEIIKRHQLEIRDERELFFQNNIKESMTDYEKVIAIHDYIIDKGIYDNRLFTEGEVPSESYSAYGILSLGVGVCESYAKSMKYLLDRADIESIVVVGNSRGENHAWNLVNIEGEYYHIDSTWDDPIIDDGTHLIRYNFLNLSDEQIEKTHNWNRLSYPEANGTKYNYYNYNNLIVLGKEELRDKITKVLLKRAPEYSLKVVNFNKELNINNIIEEIGYKYYQQIMLKGYNYILDEDQGIVSFQFYYY